MIKINLATSKVSSMPLGGAGSGMGVEFVDENDTRKNAMKRILLIMLGPLALFLYENQNIPGKINELQSKTQVLAELQAYNAKQADSVAEIKKFKEDEALIESRISALEKIAKDRQREIRVMDLLQNVIPEKAWLSRLEINPDRVNIQGMAMSDFEVSSFLEALTKSVFLMDVNLVSSNEVIEDGVVLKRFEISCLLERPDE